MTEFSAEEAEVATSFGVSPRGNLRISYLIYLLPSLVLAVIGGVRDDRVLLLVAYAVVALPYFQFIGRSSNDYVVLASVLTKYRARVSQLDADLVRLRAEIERERESTIAES
jgi:hypothetical protein